MFDKHDKIKKDAFISSSFSVVKKSYKKKFYSLLSLENER